MTEKYVKFEEEQREIYDFFTNYYNYIIVLHMYEIFQLMIDKVGKVHLCNGRADRAPHILENVLSCAGDVRVLFFQYYCVAVCDISLQGK